MPLHWSDASEDIKLKAVEVSKRWKHHYLSTEHYLHSLCFVDGQCQEWLRRRGLNLKELEEDILRLVPEGDEIPLWEGIPESPRLRRITTKFCQEEAEKQRSMRVEPVHLLAALLRETRGVAARILVEHGADLEGALGGPVSPASASASSSSSRGSSSDSSEKAVTPGKEKFLKKYSRDLVALAKQGKFDPVIGRNDEVRRVLQILTRKTKSNPVLIGEAGVGKTAVAFGLAQRIAAGQVPDMLKNKRVLDLSLSSMIAGAKHRGEFEERLEGVVQEASADPNIILFIDEIHQLVGAGDSRGGNDASNILKPALARGDFPVLGATTTDEYRRHIEQDPALERRFQPVLVGEPSEADALEILKGLKSRYEAHHGVKFTDAALLAAVKLSVRFLPDRNLPDKAIDLIDESAARIKTRSGVFVVGENPVFEVDEETIADVVSDWTGIPVSRMSNEESTRLLDMENLLRLRVVGQDHAVKAVAETIRVVRVGLTSPNRPGGVFLFLGPSGVGKTELGKALAEFLFGSDKEYVRLDMSEYHDKSSIARLIGSPPGYVGHEEEGQLTRAVRTKPYCVVLLDEVEKAHPEVFDIFLQVFDDGRLTDSKGRTVNFANTIIVLTSNLGAREVIAQGKSPLEGVAGQLDQLPQGYQAALREHFRPEFLNRIDEIVVFRALERKDLVGIVQIHLGTLIKTLREKEIELQIEQSAIDFLLEHGYQPQFGARPLQRAINTHLSRPMAQEMLRHKAGAGSVLSAYADGDKLAFRVLRKGPPSSEGPALDLDYDGGGGYSGGTSTSEPRGEQPTLQGGTRRPSAERLPRDDDDDRYVHPNGPQGDPRGGYDDPRRDSPADPRERVADPRSSSEPGGFVRPRLGTQLDENGDAPTLGIGPMLGDLPDEPPTRPRPNPSPPPAPEPRRSSRPGDPWSSFKRPED